MSAENVQSLVLLIAFAAAFYLALEITDLLRENRDSKHHTWQAQFWFDKYIALRHEVEADQSLDREAEAWKKGLADVPTPDHDEMWRNIKDAIQPPPLSLPFGSLANPILTPNGDRAHWSSIEDLTR